MQSLKKLDIGCGRRVKEGFDGLDALDIPGIKYPNTDARSLPIDDDTYDEINGQWILEHFRRAEIVDLLKEWKRVLVSGGKISLVANNQYAINCGLEDGEISWLEWEYLTLGGDLVSLGGVHKVFLNEGYVKQMFQKAGFQKIKIRSTKKVKGDKGELKCPGIIVTAIK